MSYIHDGEKQDGTCWFVVYEISQIQQKLNTNLTTYIWFKSKLMAKGIDNDLSY